MTKKKLTPEEKVTKFWEEVDQLAQAKIYNLLTGNLPLFHLKLVTHGYNHTVKHHALTGLFLHRDADYRNLLNDIEEQYSEEDLPDQEYLAEAIALNYCHLLLKALIANCQDYSSYDSSYFADLIND